MRFSENLDITKSLLSKIIIHESDHHIFAMEKSEKSEKWNYILVDVNQSVFSFLSISISRESWGRNQSFFHSFNNCNGNVRRPGLFVPLSVDSQLTGLRYRYWLFFYVAIFLFIVYSFYESWVLFQKSAVELWFVYEIMKPWRTMGSEIERLLNSC